MTLVLRMTLDEEGPWLNLNRERNGHWADRNRVTAYWRQIAGLRARPLWRKHSPLTLGRVICTYHWPDARSRTRDPGNWYPTSKAITDGLVDAGVFEDDDMWTVLGPDSRGDMGPRKIVVRVFELNDRQDET